MVIIMTDRTAAARGRSHSMSLRHSRSQFGRGLCNIMWTSLAESCEDREEAGAKKHCSMIAASLE